MLTSEEALKAAKEELYTAIQALENGDLPFARSSSLRAAGLVVEAHQSARKALTEKLRKANEKISSEPFREANEEILEFTEMFNPNFGVGFDAISIKSSNEESYLKKVDPKT